MGGTVQAWALEREGGHRAAEVPVVPAGNLEFLGTMGNRLGF